MLKKPRESKCLRERVGTFIHFLGYCLWTVARGKFYNARPLPPPFSRFSNNLIGPDGGTFPTFLLPIEVELFLALRRSLKSEIASGRLCSGDKRCFRSRSCTIGAEATVNGKRKSTTRQHQNQFSKFHSSSNTKMRSSHYSLRKRQVGISQFGARRRQQQSQKFLIWRIPPFVSFIRVLFWHVPCFPTKWRQRKN